MATEDRQAAGNPSYHAGCLYLDKKKKIRLWGKQKMMISLPAGVCPQMLAKMQAMPQNFLKQRLL